MSKKRSCRRTTDEGKIHEKAVKMRKMTDEQLVHYVEDRVAKAKSEGYNEAKGAVEPMKLNVERVVEKIARIKGVGLIKLEEIRKILEGEKHE